MTEKIKHQTGMEGAPHVGSLSNLCPFGGHGSHFNRSAPTWLDSITNSVDLSDEFEQTLGDSGGQRSLACCSPWGHSDSDRTGRLDSNPKLGDWVLGSQPRRCC